jgi:Icc-related predicted phosphoesterase
MRIAALGDPHARDGDRNRLRAIFGDVKQDADVLVLTGDLTHHGFPEEMAVLLSALAEVKVPVIAVLGNHDHELGSVTDLANMMKAAGVHLLDPGRVVINGVGFAGAKGFCGGFDDRLIRSFGEASVKAFVAESAIEAAALRSELCALPTDKRVAVLHYAPTRATVEGEPPEIHAFLGTSRLAEALDDGKAVVAFHGHAHRGGFRGETPGGIPVFNVSQHVLETAGIEKPYFVYEV